MRGPDHPLVYLGQHVWLGEGLLTMAADADPGPASEFLVPHFHLAMGE